MKFFDYLNIKNERFDEFRKLDTKGYWRWKTIYDSVSYICLTLYFICFNIIILLFNLFGN